MTTIPANTLQGGETVELRMSGTIDCAVERVTVKAVRPGADPAQPEPAQPAQPLGHMGYGGDCQVGRHKG